jgi:hypothetical protein
VPSSDDKGSTNECALSRWRGMGGSQTSDRASESGFRSVMQRKVGASNFFVCHYQSSSVYSSQSLYAIINFRGVTPVFVPAVWSLPNPPRVHFFSRLLSKNKLLTRDNLEKRRVDDKSCLFCSEPESVYHLFFECVIARQTWLGISEVIGAQIGQDFESVARRWLCNKKLA